MPFSCLIVMQYLEAQYMMGLVWMGHFYVVYFAVFCGDGIQLYILTL